MIFTIENRLSIFYYKSILHNTLEESNETTLTGITLRQKQKKTEDE